MKRLPVPGVKSKENTVKEKDLLNHKACKYRIYPNDEQITQLFKTWGCVRFVYNKLLDLQKSNRENGIKHMTGVDMNNYVNRSLKNEFPWLKEVDKFSLTNAALALDRAYKGFFNKICRFPKYKSRRNKQSYTTNYTNNNIEVFDNSIKLPKLGRVEAIIHRKPSDKWKIKGATISMETDGSIYVSVLMERIDKIDIEAIEKKMPKNPVAFDYVSDGLICDQGGDILGSPKYYRNASKRLKRAQKKLSHMIESHITGYTIKDGKRFPKYDKPLKECKNIEKQRKKIAKLSRHVANQRKDFLHKTSAAIAKAHDGVYVESLNMKDMSNKGFKNGKATLDNGYGMFLTMLEYKVEKNGGIFIKVDKWYPSSQLCSTCGFKNADVKDLRVMKWICPACGKAHERNQNAAENILKEGTRIAKSIITANAA